MLRLPASVRVFVCLIPVDMRRSFDGLAAAEQVVRQNPLSGHLFGFRGRRGDRVKVLWWDRDGYALYVELDIIQVFSAFDFCPSQKRKERAMSVNPYYVRPWKLERYRVGPLSLYLDGFSGYLQEKGYARSTGQRYVREAGRLSQPKETLGSATLGWPSFPPAIQPASGTDQPSPVSPHAPAHKTPEQGADKARHTREWDKE